VPASPLCAIRVSTTSLELFAVTSSCFVQPVGVLKVLLLMMLNAATSRSPAWVADGIVIVAVLLKAPVAFWV
jgi:hypothetical protein